MAPLSFNGVYMNERIYSKKRYVRFAGLPRIKLKLNRHIIITSDYHHNLHCSTGAKNLEDKL